MEHVGFNQGFIHGSLHSKEYNHIIGTQKTDTVFLNDCSESYHNYGLEWTADSIKISVDHKVFFSTGKNNEDYAGWPFDQPFHLILNQAVGGNWGGAKGVDEKIWPQKMWVDYVRVYQ
jgi:beta-glucanase (GH16 family)